MTAFKLFGTTTSPYVRRVRIVAHELGVDYQLIDTFTEAGQAAMRAACPIWKVPAAELASPGGADLVYDSHAITELLLHRHGPGNLAPYDPYDSTTRNAMSVIDGSVDALINVFYLRRDGVAPDQASYMQKQIDRAESALAWLEERAGALTDTPFGLPQIALATTIDWIAFRDTAPLDPYPALIAATKTWNDRPSLATTRPG